MKNQEKSHVIHLTFIIVTNLKFRPSSDLLTGPGLVDFVDCMEQTAEELPGERELQTWEDRQDQHPHLCATAVPAAGDGASLLFSKGMKNHIPQAQGAC